MSKIPFLNFESNLSQRVWQQWQVLSAREKLLLSVMAVFLFVIALYGTWQFHQQAVTQKQQYDQKVNDYFWLRAQSANLVADNQPLNNDQSSQSVTNIINDILIKAGIKNPKVVVSNDVVNIAFASNSQAIIGTVFGELEKLGIITSQLQVKQDPTTKVLTVQAVVTNNSH